MTTSASPWHHTVRAGLILILVGFGASQAGAASQADEDACRPDVFRLCAGAIPNEAEIVTCLDAKLPSLSPACRAVMAPGEPAAMPAPARKRRRIAEP